MDKPRYHPHSCRRCHAHESQVGRISARGNCAECGERVVLENVAAMRARTGPQWARWRRAMAACVGGDLLDERADKV